MKILETNRLRLRAWNTNDAEVLYKYASDPEVGPRVGWNPHTSVEESRTIIDEVFAPNDFWAVELKQSGEPIGCVGYLLPGVSNIPIGADDAEIGYWIARPYWNQGICTEAMTALVDFCFSEKHFNALWGDCFLDNPASERVMLHCGFADTGTRTSCPNLLSGADRIVKVLKLSR